MTLISAHTAAMFESALPATIDAHGRLRLPRSVVEAVDERFHHRRLFVPMLSKGGVMLFPLMA